METLTQLVSKNPKRVMIISYNQVRGIKPLFKTIFSLFFHVMDNSFAKPKSRDKVLKHHPRVQEALSLRNEVDRIIVFLGKVDSGSLEIAEFVDAEYADVRHKLYFVLCPHDPEEKKAWLASHGYPSECYCVFEDHPYRAGEQCLEWPALFGEAMKEVS